MRPGMLAVIFVLLFVELVLGTKNLALISNGLIFFAAGYWVVKTFCLVRYLNEETNF